ncbi:hypothetical protein F5Y11DRAFT_360596 [Daldinia sp. FL1419]|nr:hypothetical protein F5Y11DRAFT_360596 [Daldinia sp. FL1419]
MSGRRRPATRQTEAIEPTEPVTRQTRRSARRHEASVESESRSQVKNSQRGAEQRHRRSLEDDTINEVQGTSIDHVDHELGNPGLVPISGPVVSPNITTSESDDVHESLEVNAARIQDMLDFDIPKLTRWSGNMYDILSSMDSNQPSMEDRSKLNSIRKSYNHARLSFADAGALFIKPIYFFEDYDAGIRAKIQIAICSGNIISLLLSIVDVTTGKRRSLPILEQLNDSFPVPFCLDLQENDTKQLLDLAFRIRVRYIVDTLAAKSSADPSELASGIFYSESRVPEDSQAASSQQQYKLLAGININENSPLCEIYQTRIQGVLSILSSNDRSEAESRLDHNYPQNDLFSGLRSWALEMYERLNMPTDPGNINTPKPTQEDTHALVRRQESESLFVEGNEESRDDPDSESDTDADGYDQLPTQEFDQNFIDSSAMLAAVRQSENQHVQGAALSPPSNQQAIENEQVLGIGDAIRRLDAYQVIGRSRKRPAPSEDGANEGDDDYFEVNEQLLDESRRPRNEDRTAQGPPSKRPRISERSRNLEQPRIPHHQQVPREWLEGDIFEDLTLRQRDIFRLSQEARNIRRATFMNKPRQIRVPWSASDTSRLLDLIADPSISCSWSTIAKIGDFENPRNQQQVRDKARGLKVWYLEGDRILPPGFDQVVLGQKEKDAVIKCGRNPDRKEDDLDEDGKITNNIWVD